MSLTLEEIGVQCGLNKQRCLEVLEAKGMFIANPNNNLNNNQVEKIKKQKDVVATSKDKYEAALNELNLLIKKKQDLQGKELINAFVNSDKSLDEILAFMGWENEDNT